MPVAAEWPKRIKLNLSSQDRVATRAGLIAQFTKEQPGTGTGNLATKYNYLADTSIQGYEIYLCRPARLNKGFDFVVTVPELRVNDTGQIPHIPRYRDIVKFLQELKQRFPGQYKKLSDDIHAVYRCDPPAHLKELSGLICTPVRSGEAGVPADVLVLMTRWLFAEQDFTYWNYSGRAKFFSHLDENGLL